MKTLSQNLVDSLVAATLVLGLAGAYGCSGKVLPETVAVQGKLSHATGNVSDLAGHSLEIKLDSDPLVRAYGEIKPDGAFELETLQGGSTLSGAVPGKYQARIILSDDDADSRRRAKQAVHERFLEFETSGLTLQVPAAQPLVLAVSNQ